MATKKKPQPKTPEAPAAAAKHPPPQRDADAGAPGEALKLLGHPQLHPLSRLVAAAVALSGRAMHERDLKPLVGLPSGDIDIAGRQIKACQLGMWRNGLLSLNGQERDDG